MTNRGRGPGERSEFWFWVARQKHTLRSLAKAAGVPYYKVRYHSAGFRGLEDVELQQIAGVTGRPTTEIPVFDIVWRSSTSEVGEG